MSMIEYILYMCTSLFIKHVVFVKKQKSVLRRIYSPAQLPVGTSFSSLYHVTLATVDNLLQECESN